MPKAYGYRRLSKDEVTAQCIDCKMEWTLDHKESAQTELECPHCQKVFPFSFQEAVSIQAQKDRILQLMLTKVPRTIDPKIEILTDVNVSAEIPIRDRPKGAELFALLRDGDYLIVSKLDRLFRNVEDCCKQVRFFQRMNIHLILGDFPEIDLFSPFGEFFIKLMANVAEWERHRISERTKEGLRKRKAMGKPFCCHPPKGYSLMCSLCTHIYTVPEYKKGLSCPSCKCRRTGNSENIPNKSEHALMWRLLWYRSGYHFLQWDMIVDNIHIDGIRSRDNGKLGRRKLQEYWDAGCWLLYQGKLLNECRPAHMENLTLEKLVDLPGDLKKELEEKSRKDSVDGLGR